jgi:ankyrin repeat protein
MKMRECESGSDEDKSTRTFPMMNAIVLGNTVRFKQLLASGAGVNARDDRGRTPLHWAIWKMNLEYAKALLEAGADINAKDQGGRTPLLDGVWHAELTRFLIDAGADVNLADEEGKTPLMLAAEEYTAGEQVRRLIAAGANVNARERFGQTPLMSAIIPQHIEAVRALLAAGVDVNARNDFGQTALLILLAFPPEPLPPGAVPLRAARMEMDSLGKWESIRRMLLAAGTVQPDPEAIRRIREGSRGSRSFGPDYSQDGDPLVQAILADDLATARRLLTRGANPSGALRKAVESHASASAIKLLISSGADINESQEPGGTPLMSATLYQHAEGVRLLLAAGVRVNARDEKGCTALSNLSEMALIAPIPETDRQDIVTAWRGAEERTAKIRAMLVAAGAAD